MKRYLTLILGIGLIWSCESEDLDNSGGTNNPVPNTAFYNHDSEIKAFTINGNNISIIDSEGLTLDLNGQKEFYESVSYSIENHSFNAKLNNVNDMISNGDELYIGTQDGHLLKYQDGEFSGFPIRIHKMKRLGQNQQIQAIWEWYYDDFPIDFPSGKMRTEIELDGENLRIRDEWPCLDALNPTINYCDEYDLTDFASLERLSTVGDNGRLLTIPDYSNNNLYEYSPNFSELPFNKFKQIEFFNHASGFGDPPDKFYFDHIWVSTDIGLAYYLMQEGEDIAFDPNEWKYLNKDNSELSSNTIEDIRVLENERLIAYSNTPPSINYINAEDGDICSFSAPTSEDISQIYVDFYDLYVAQGKDIFEIKNSDMESECGY